MATNYGVQATKRANQSIPQLEEQGYKRGQVYSAHDYFALSADLASGDVIRLMKLPQGARVIDARLKFDDLDASGGTLDVGWEAGATAAEAADDDGILADVDVTSAGKASLFQDQPTRPAYQKVFSEEVQVAIKVDGDTDATSGSVYLDITFVID